MKYFSIFILLSIFFIGCGHKADPIYIDDTKKTTK